MSQVMLVAHEQMKRLDEEGESYQAHIQIADQEHPITFDVMGHGPTSITVVLPGLCEPMNPIRLRPQDVTSLTVEEL